MKKWFLIIYSLFLFSGCALLRDLADVRRPTLEYSDMSIEQINFNEAVLLFNFDISNPNTIGLTANSYAYELFVNDNSFLSGDQQENLRIAREATSTLQVPVRLQFSELVNTFSSLLQSDAFDYRLNTEIQFDIPGLGVQRLPVNASGSLPIPKVPRFEFGGFEVNRLTMAGADMEFRLNVTNTNQFPISFFDAGYSLEVNGKDWLTSTIDRAIHLSASESSEIVIPVQLNATQMGSVLFELMRDNAKFEYRLTGNANIGAEIEGNNFRERIPFSVQGTYQK